MIAVGSLAGCESPKSPDDQSLPVSQGKGLSTEEGSSAKADEPTHVVPGINFAPPPDDAGADGWQTEELSSAVGHQLQQIAVHFASSANKTNSAKAKPALSDIVTADISFQSLRPTETETAFEDAAFTLSLIHI